LGSRKNSIIVEVQPKPEVSSDTEDSRSSFESEDSDQELEEQEDIVGDSPETTDKTDENSKFIVAKEGEFTVYLPAPVPDTVTKMPDIEMPGFSSSGNGKLKAISGLIVVLIVAAFAIAMSALHKIEEGNVGVYYKNGALMEAIAFPGVHYMTPFIVEVVEIKIRPETENLDSMTSITKDGIQNTFNEVQVITSIKMDKLIFMLKNFGPQFKRALVFDRIKEELRIFCANSTIDEVYNTKFLAIVEQVKGNVMESIERLGEGGITLLNLVIPKPTIPSDIAKNYKMVKVQWTEQLVATQQQKTEAIKKETEKLRAIADAERNKAVLQIKIQERILEKEGDSNISALNNAILKEKEENVANIEKYKILSEASANKELFTPEYIQYNTAKNMANNTKYYFSGQDSLLNGVLTKIFN